MLDVVVGLTCGQGSRLASLDAAADLLAAAAEAEDVRGSRVYSVDLEGGPENTLAAAVRLSFQGPLEGLREQLAAVRTQLSLSASEPRPGALFLEMLWVRAQGGAGPGDEGHHPGLWWCTHALAPLLDVAPELRETFELSLGWAGGAPPAEPWAHVWGRGLEVSRYTDRAAATAGAAMWRALQLGLPEERPRMQRDWDPTPEADDLEGALAQIDVARAEGFHVRSAVVLDTDGPRWRGRLYGVEGEPTPVEQRPLALKLHEAGNGVALRLAPAS